MSKRRTRRRGGAETAGQSSRRRRHLIVLSLSFCALHYYHDSQERTSEANRAQEKIIQGERVKEFRVYSVLGFRI